MPCLVFKTGTCLIPVLLVRAMSTGLCIPPSGLPSGRQPKKLLICQVLVPGPSSAGVSFLAGIQIVGNPFPVAANSFWVWSHSFQSSEGDWFSFSLLSKYHLEIHPQVETKPIQLSLPDAGWVAGHVADPHADTEILKFTKVVPVRRGSTDTVISGVGAALLAPFL